MPIFFQTHRRFEGTSRGLLGLLSPLRQIEEGMSLLPLCWTIPHLSAPWNSPLNPLFSRLNKFSFSKPFSPSHALKPLLIISTVLRTLSSVTRHVIAVTKSEDRIPVEDISVQIENNSDLLLIYSRLEFNFFHEDPCWFYFVCVQPQCVGRGPL